MRTAELRELQRRFWLALAGDPGGEAPPALLAAITPGPRLAPATRFQVYANAYLWRLLDVLRGDFPRVAAWQGEEEFAAVAHDYFAATPSTHPSLRHLGAAFPTFLARHAPDRAFLADLARLEWARVEVFDAPDTTPVTAAALRAVAAERWPMLRFTPVPALAVVRSAWAIDAAWRGIDAATPPARVATAVRVWRGAEGSVLQAAMDSTEAVALERLTAGEPFAAICGAYTGLPDTQAAAAAVAQLARWLEDGILATAG
ncbi:MAG: DNA-binding domain-containing protein [Candidatus Binatia bacterium]